MILKGPTTAGAFGSPCRRLYWVIFRRIEAMIPQDTPILMRGRTVLLVSHHVQLCDLGASYIVALGNGHLQFH